MELDYLAIFKELNKLGIDYMVVGGLAVNFHGVPRMTYDVDFMISFKDTNVRKLAAQLKTWGYRLKIPIDPMDLGDDAKRESWIREKGMKAVNFYSDTSPIGEIDIVIESPISYDELKQRSVKIQFGDVMIPTVSIHDLIQLKKHAGREQDLDDIEHLKVILEK